MKPGDRVELRPRSEITGYTGIADRRKEHGLADRALGTVELWDGGGWKARVLFDGEKAGRIIRKGRLRAAPVDPPVCCPFCRNPTAWHDTEATARCAASAMMTCPTCRKPLAQHDPAALYTCIVTQP